MKMRFKECDSPTELTNLLRFMFIELVEMEVWKSARSDDRYENVSIQNRKKPHRTGKNSISVYVNIDVFLMDDQSGRSLEIVVRLSDHPSDDMTDGETVEEDGTISTFILRNVNDTIRIRTKIGIEYNWNDLDWYTQKIPLIDGDDAVIAGDVVISGVGSKYYIDPLKEGEVGGMLNNAKNSVMSSIHAFINQA